MWESWADGEQAQLWDLITIGAKLEGRCALGALMSAEASLYGLGPHFLTVPASA